MNRSLTNWLGPAAIALFGAYLLLPVAATLLFSLATRWSTTVLPEGLTLEFYAQTWENPQFLPALGHSLVLGAGAVLVDLVVVLPTMYWLHVQTPRLRLWTDLITIIPFALPWVVVALALIRFYGEVAPALLGSWQLLLFAHAAVAMPFLYWAVDNSLYAINPRLLHEAAVMLGASWPQILRRVILPNIRTGIATGSILVFATSFGEFALAQLLTGQAYRTLPVFQAAILRLDGHAAAVLTIVSFAVTWGASLLIVLVTGGSQAVYTRTR
jgi:putative spermidine/putrescine transport system permease protein